MNRFLLAGTAALALFLVGCAEDLSPEIKDRPPAAYSPDPTQYLPQTQDYSRPGI